ncbi:ABC transporter ATP-binding protein [Anaerosalibacter massiliensis]|uniref:ABC transporter ATP-binding protein n=1 Tax=Anaerosalibacter massiliensis TaxID=1347392 RepID=A0A9X2S837_9FIRM|nr:ABC transporter ATP-binding protein [Anaerosalibacter massiliensis]MCR2045422.1 ABC transporter ATP-binding protein [Anaerosalibacter massiliensis]
MKNIVEIKNLTKSYPNFKLDSINMELPYGEIIGLIGENGAGKTTLISLLLNQLHLESGEIRIFDMKYNKNEMKIKQNIGFVVDECCFHSCLNPKEINNIMKYIYSKWCSETFFKLLKDLKISEVIEVNEMSKGMKKKLMLAVALSHNPKLLILDEVTSGLDPVIRDDILTILQRSVLNKKTTVIFSTHITSDLDKIADKVAFLHKGKLVFYEPMDILKKKYKIVECSKNNYNIIKKENIVTSYLQNGKYHVLINNKENISNYKGLVDVKTPNLDDIMLAYIKGDRNYDRAT